MLDTALSVAISSIIIALCILLQLERYLHDSYKVRSYDQKVLSQLWKSRNFPGFSNLMRHIIVKKEYANPLPCSNFPQFDSFVSRCRHNEVSIRCKRHTGHIMIVTCSKHVSSPSKIYFQNMVTSQRTKQNSLVIIWWTNEYMDQRSHSSVLRCSKFQHFKSLWQTPQIFWW
jgi:hypothetical protein